MQPVVVRVGWQSEAAGRPQLHGSGSGLSCNAVVKGEERKPKHPERVFCAQGAVFDEHVELLLEAVHGQGSELVRGRVDVGEVVPSLPVVGAAGECQATVGA